MLSSDPLSSGSHSGFGCTIEAPDAPLVKLDEVNGHVDATKFEHSFRVGELLTIIPYHVCTCVNLLDAVSLIHVQFSGPAL